MRNEINNDNIYKEGTIICAKVDPALKLMIMKYRQRIYYCAVVDHPEQNNLVYFEKELIPPDVKDQQVQFTRIVKPPLSLLNFKR
jgi:hypothetical protein